MQFSLLGNVTACRNGRPLRLGGQQRAVLAVLLFQPNVVVRRTEIVRLAWGDRPDDTPRTINALVADYISRLRTAVRQAGADGEVTLTARQPGYLLEVDEETIDWHRFRRLADRARRARDAAELDDAAGLLWDALNLWQGPALADVGPALEPIRRQLDDRRLAAAEDLAAIELTRGQADRVVPLLAELAAGQPAREGLATLLIQALHATGRRDEAVAVYHRSRRHLADRLGLSPAEAMENAHQALLNGQQPRWIPPPPAGPAQLPLDTSNFTGRAAELAELLALAPAATAAADAAPAAGVICVVDGMAGVGKTALAVHAAHRLARRFADGQLFLDLHGYTANVPPVEPAEALDRLLRSMGVAGEKIPEHLDDRAALYRDRLAGRRMLILLDNARSADQVRPLLPAAPGCLVLVTSRRRLTALDDAHPLTLETLPAADAALLFGRVAGLDRVSGQHAEVERIAGLCGGLPLAVRIAAARLRNHPAWQPRYLADRLADAQEPPWDLADGERSIAAAFMLSYRELTALQQRMFRLLGLVPGRDVDAHAAAALIEAPPRRAARLLQELLDAHLLAQQVADRYGCHDLMRFFAADLAAAEDSPTARRAALTRLLDHQLQTASTALDVLFPHERRHRPRLPAPGPANPDVSARSDARAWLNAERINLVAAAGFAADHGWPDHTRQLDLILSRYLLTGAHYANALELHQHALRAVRGQGNRAGEGTALHQLGNTYLRLGRYEDALVHLRHALAAHQEAGNRGGEAITLTRIGVVLGLHGRYADALEQLQQALALSREVHDQANEANTLTNLGNLHLHRGGYAAALDHYQRALRLFVDIGDRAGEAGALTNLGNIHLRGGDYEPALDHYQQALHICADIGDRAGEGTALTNLGEVHERCGRHHLALDHLRRALVIFRAIGHRPYQSETLSLLASCCAALKRYAESVEHLQQALRTAREIGDRTLEAAIRNGLGTTLRAAGRPEEALASHRSALAVASRLGNRYERARAIEGIAELLDAAGESDAARQHWQEALDVFTDLGVAEAHRVRSRLHP